MGQANSQHRLGSHTHTHTQAAGRQAFSRSDTGPYGRPLELLPFAEIGEGQMEGCRDGRRMARAGGRSRKWGEVEINQQATPTARCLWGVETGIYVTESRVTNGK